MDQFPPKFVRDEVALPDGSTLKVRSDEVLLSGLSQPGKPVPIHGTRVLTLDDGTDEGTVLFGCNDCEFTDPGRGQVRKHRTEKHGEARPGARRRRAAADDDAEALELTYPVAEVVSPEVLSMDLGELIELAQEVVHYRRIIDNISAERDEWKGKAQKSRGELRQIKTRLAPFFKEEPAATGGEGH